MKKIFLILIVLLLFTGCDAEYNITLNRHNEIEEELNLIIDNISDDESNKDYLLDFEPYAIISKSDKIKYDKEIIEKDNHVIGKYSYTYSIPSYKQSQLFEKCYDLYGIKEDDKYYYISTSGKFNCLVYDYIPVDSVKINFKTDYVVYEHNADYVENDIYTWIIDKSNSNDKAINIIVDKNTINNVDENNLFDGIKLLFITTVIILIVGILITFIIKITGVKKNRI